MSKWTFLTQGDPPLTPDAAARFKAQVLSDIYKVMQSRMDGYRQTAAAIFIGIVAASFAMDSTLAKYILDPGFLVRAGDKQSWDAVFTIAVLGSLSTVIAGVGAFMIRRLAGYFAEMTSIIFKIDVQNDVFEPGAWIKDDTLYPPSFNVSTKQNVARGRNAPQLWGWRDPSLNLLGWLAGILFLLHVAVYGVLTWWFHCHS